MTSEMKDLRYVRGGQYTDAEWAERCALQEASLRNSWKARAEAAEARCARLETVIRNHLKLCTEDTWQAMQAALSDTAPQEMPGTKVTHNMRKLAVETGRAEMRERAAKMLWEPDQEMVDDLAAAVITMPTAPPKSPHRIARTVLRAAVAHVQALPIDPETGEAG